MEKLLDKKPGEGEGDGLKDPSIVSPDTAEKKQMDSALKKGVKKASTGGPKVSIDIEKLLNPDRILSANEGAMPVTEEEIKEQSTRQQRRSQIINQLDEAGLSVPAIKAIVGNIDIETGGTFSHTQKQEGGNGYGLFQLDFQKPFYDKYLESQNLEDSISSQVSYFLNEINTGDTIGAGNAKSIMDVFNDPKTTPKEATIVLVDKFFKPGKPHLERRIASAMQGYDEELEGFKEGGLADNADDTPGATESEVADDIPAMISEGELVVPANVVRYHGLAKYENMRKTALKALDELEDNGQIRPVDEDGTPIAKDVKEQTDEVMASKGATVARYNEGGSPTIEKDEKVIGRPVDPDLTKDLKPVGPRVTTREGQTITPDDSGNKATLTTPEGKNYRVTNPDTKITATGPRTTKVIGSDDVGGVDFDGVQFGKKRTPVTVSGPSTGEKLLSGITTVAALDQLFNDGKITESVYNWSKENIFDPLGEFLGFDKAATAIKTGPLAGSSIVNGQLTLADGTMDIVTSLSGADTVGKAIADGTVISANSYLQGIPANAEIITRFDNASFVATDFDSGFTGADHYAVFKDADGATQTVKITNAQKAQLEAGNSIGGNVVSNDGLFSWKGGLATIGTALSLYDLIENGPSVANVAGTAAGVGGMVSANVFGLAGTAFGKSALGSGLAAAATPLAFVALAAGLVDAFSGPPTNAVAEAGINFDNPEYKESDILIGGFTGKKFSQDNTDAVTQLSASIGSYVSSMEQALEINIGGELFLDVGSTRGLRYGYVDGYDELGMYKYHKKDLDYKLLHGQGQTGKGYLGEDAVTNLMNDIQDDTNVVVMFALADKAAGGNGYATYDDLPLYRQKISTLKTYRPGMAGTGAKAVLTEQERNLLDGFQKKEFAEVTGNELAALMPIYDKIAPVQQNNFNSLVM